MIHQLQCIGYKMLFSPEFFSSLCNDDIAVIDDFLPPEQYSAIRQMAKQLYDSFQFQPAGIGRLQNYQTNNVIRKDEIYWLDPNEPALPAQIMLSALNSLMQQLNESIFLSLINFEAHLAVYQPGSFYRKHNDQFKGNDSRIISCVYYLNDDWQEEDGGHLVVYEENRQVKQRLLPIGNRLVCFKSFLVHEVEESKKQRLSVTAWLKRRNDLVLTES